MTEPIRPDEISKLKQAVFPDEVFEAFNEEIAKAFSGRSARVYQRDVISAIMRKGKSRKQIFDNHWLDVESVYEQAGWRVTYDGPGYNETYEPYWIFTKR